MHHSRRISLANIFKGGAHLVRRMPSIAVLTIASALIEPFLPDRAAFHGSLDRPVWDSLVAVLASPRSFIIAAVSLFVFQAVLGCWFTRSAFRIEEGPERTVGGFARYLARYLLTASLVAMGFAAGAFLAAFLLAAIVFPVSPVAEKAIFLLAAAAGMPALAVLFSFATYWLYVRPSLPDAYRAIASSLLDYGLKAYGFFTFTVVLRLIGVMAWYAILSSPIAYPVRLLLAAIILAAVTMFLRGIRFEFQYLHEVNRLSKAE